MTNHIIQNLTEIDDLLKGLSREQYSRKLEILTDSSIGQHVRHILEFYQCLLKGKYSGEVNYDSRRRDLKLESDLRFASSTIKILMKELLDVKRDFPVTFVSDYSTSRDKNPIRIQSTFFRELAYNLEHSIHHQALIKVAITEMKLTALVKETFGYAPSTIRHIKTCAQ